MSMDKVGKQHREEICPGKRNKLDLEQVRERVAGTKGPEFWRSLEELAGNSEFQDMMHREFPKGASEWLDSIPRREFLKLMGASLALAGMTACTKQPLEPIVPYVSQPEEMIPGRPLFYATAFTLGGYASPLLVESHLYRPTKIEGNDQHPASLGGTDVFAQSSILGMYDPDRSETVTYLGDVRTKDLYRIDNHDIANEVREWAIENGDDNRLRIVLAGYEDEHAAKMPDSWRKLAWMGNKSYGTTAAVGTKEGNDANRANERLWFSPSCVKEMSLFEAMKL